MVSDYISSFEGFHGHLLDTLDFGGSLHVLINIHKHSCCVLAWDGTFSMTHGNNSLVKIEVGSIALRLPLENHTVSNRPMTLVTAIWSR